MSLDLNTTLLILATIGMVLIILYIKHLERKEEMELKYKNLQVEKPQEPRSSEVKQ